MPRRSEGLNPRDLSPDSYLKPHAATDFLKEEAIQAARNETKKHRLPQHCFRAQCPLKEQSYYRDKVTQ